MFSTSQQTQSHRWECPHLTEDRHSQALLRTCLGLDKGRGTKERPACMSTPLALLSSALCKETNSCHVNQGPGLTALTSQSET